MSKKKKNVLASLDAYEVTKDTGNEFDYIRVRSKSGSWGLSFRSDSPMFGVWEAMCADKEYSKGIEVICTMAYSLTNSLLDEPFIAEFFDSLDAMNKRKVANKADATEKEHESALQESEIMEKISREEDAMIKEE